MPTDREIGIEMLFHMGSHFGIEVNYLCQAMGKLGITHAEATKVNKFVGKEITEAKWSELAAE